MAPQVISLPAWFIQTAGAYFGPLVLEMVVVANWIGGPDSVKVAFLIDASMAAMSLVLGLVVYLVSPNSAQTGRWVWVGPIVLLGFFLLWEMSEGDFHVLTILFGMGEEGYVHAFVTAPTMSCLCYSAVMALGMRWRQHRMQA